MNPPPPGHPLHSPHDLQTDFDHFSLVAPFSLLLCCVAVAFTNATLRAPSWGYGKWEAKCKLRKDDYRCLLCSTEASLSVLLVSPIHGWVGNDKISRIFLFLLIFLFLKTRLKRLFTQVSCDAATFFFGFVFGRFLVFLFCFGFCFCLRIEIKEENPSSEKIPWLQGSWLLLKCR